jgi:hypothetical protein
MKKTVKTLNLAAIMLLLAGVIVSCGKEDDIPNDPTKTILGKWELVELEYFDGRKEAYQPTGYIEYLPDGLMAWVDYATQKYEILLGNTKPLTIHNLYKLNINKIELSFRLFCQRFGINTGLIVFLLIIYLILFKHGCCIINLIMTVIRDVVTIQINHLVAILKVLL